MLSGFCSKPTVHWPSDRIPVKCWSAIFPKRRVEIITTVGTGKFVSPYYDSMVAQVIVHAKTRNAAADKLIAYLDKVAISGICTNIPLLKLVLADDVFRKGKYDTTDYLPQLLKRTDIEKLIAEIDASSGSAGSGIDRDSVLIDGTDEMKVLAPATAIFYNTPSPSSQSTSV